MAKSANEVRVGNVLEYNKGLFRVLSRMHVQPGKGGAFVQMELKEITNGQKLNERFRSEDKVDVAILELADYQYLFDSGDTITVMSNETFEQIELNKELLNGKDKYLQDGMVISVEKHGERIVGATVPSKVTLKVAETEPVVKGQTASGSNKPAILENGVRVMVPPFVSVDDLVVVNTEEDSYMERAK
jgi:elongation factor P